MIQGGDPTGTGRGGESIYGKAFEDEIRSDLAHVGIFPLITRKVLESSVWLIQVQTQMDRNSLSHLLRRRGWMESIRYLEESSREWRR
jgi:cyclophilin family peptidyl-prolyl cis-trans isomerase